MNREPPNPVPPPGAPRALPAIGSAELLGGFRERTIIHNGQHYLLRITANNKLILTR